MDGIRLYGDEIRGAGVCGDTRKKVDAASRDVALRDFIRASAFEELNFGLHCL